MDLSFDYWDYKISSIKFESENDVLNFVADCQPKMDQVINSHDHDRFTYFVKFYQEFKSQTASLFDFIRSYEPQDFANDERPDCVGRTLKLKTILENAYPELKDKFYISSCAIDYENSNNNLTWEMIDNFHYLVNFNEHCLLTLKFEVEERTGFILYEMSFLNNKPLIVMMDNQSPSCFTVPLAMGRKATYWYEGENYVQISFNPVEEQNEDCTVTGVDVFTIAVYVGAAFKRPDISTSYCLLTNIQYAYAIRNGKLALSFSRYGEDKTYKIQRWDKIENNFVIWEVPIDYFLQNVPNQIFEEEFVKLADAIGYEKDVLKNYFIELSKIQIDGDFLRQLSELPLAVKKANESYVKSFHMNIRNRFFEIEYYIATRARKFQEKIHTPIQFIV